MFAIVVSVVVVVVGIIVVVDSIIGATGSSAIARVDVVFVVGIMPHFVCLSAL